MMFFGLSADILDTTFLDYTHGSEYFIMGIMWVIIGDATLSLDIKVSPPKKQKIDVMRY